jgi:hypothetical protein
MSLKEQLMFKPRTHFEQVPLELVMKLPGLEGAGELHEEVRTLREKKLAERLAVAKASRGGK